MAKSTIDPTKDREDQDADDLDEDQDADDLDDEDESDSDDGDDADDDGDESDSDDDDTALKALKLTPEQLKYVNGLKSKVAKANAQSAAKRRRLAELRKEARKAPTKTEDRPRRKTGEPSVAEVLEQFKAEAKAERDQERLMSAAERALRNAGLALPEESGAAERKLARALKLLDLEGATPADVDDLVADLKDDEPALFKRTRKPKPRTGGVSGPARARAGTRAKDDVERALDL